MAFFENLSRKATETTAKAMQKAQELSEITRLNGLILEEERKVNDAYAQIGKLYVSLHAADAEAPFAELIAAVQQGQQKAEEWQRQVQDLKGVQRCEACGAQVPKGSAFCTACGAPMPKPQPATPPADCVPCANCGAFVKRGMRFCTSCGHPMPQPDAPAPAPAPDPAPQPAEKFCPNCGAKMEGDAAFCTECGARL